MRGIITMVALTGMIGTGVALAGPSNAVSEDITCATLSTAIDDFSAKSGAIDTADPSALTQSKNLWAELTSKFTDAEAVADEGRVKTALNGAVDQLNRVAAVADSDRPSVQSDPAFKNAMSAVDTACGF
jgi:hypothetical protein